MTHRPKLWLVGIIPILALDMTSRFREASAMLLEGLLPPGGAGRQPPVRGRPGAGPGPAEEGAQAVLSFLGRKCHGKFEGEAVTDQWGQALRGRLPGHRGKHRMKQNWLKMYDKASSVLRVETGINQPEEFRVRRRVRRRDRRRTEWVPLRKSVASLFRYRELSIGLRGLDAITPRKPSASRRPAKAFNPVARSECQLFTTLMSGEHAVHGFTNRDLRDKLTATSVRLNPDPKRQSAQVSRLLSRLHVYGLVAKIPRSRRWRVTAFGHRVMSASVKLRKLHFPSFYAEAA